MTNRMELLLFISPVSTLYRQMSVKQQRIDHYHQIL